MNEAPPDPNKSRVQIRQMEARLDQLCSRGKAAAWISLGILMIGSYLPAPTWLNIFTGIAALAGAVSLVYVAQIDGQKSKIRSLLEQESAEKASAISPATSTG